MVNPLLFRKLTGYPRRTDSSAVPSTSHSCLHTSPVDSGSSRSLPKKLPPASGLVQMLLLHPPPGQFLPSPQAFLSCTTSQKPPLTLRSPGEPGALVSLAVLRAVAHLIENGL